MKPDYDKKKFDVDEYGNLYPKSDKEKCKCKKHPRYKAIRKPTADCSQCRRIWGAKKYFDFINEK